MPPLANVNCSACFSRVLFKLTTGEMVLVVGSKTAIGT